MNDKLFNYIYDAMNLALEYMDENTEPIECEKERNKLDKAIGLFYDWYQTAWEFPKKAEEIEPKDEMSDEKTRKIIESLEEIQSICIGADSPDALEHGERDPIEELQCCREDLGAISNITEQLLQTIGE